MQAGHGDLQHSWEHFTCHHLLSFWVLSFNVLEHCYFIKCCLTFTEGEKQAERMGLWRREVNKQLLRCLPTGTALKLSNSGREHPQNLIFKSLMVLECIIKLKGHKWTKSWSTQTCIEVRRMCSHEDSATWLFWGTWKGKTIYFISLEKIILL